MRNSLTKVVAALGVFLAVSAGSAKAQGTEAAGSEAVERAALRSVARAKIQEAVERSVVRPTDPAVITAEARRIAKRLSDDQLRALAAGEDVQKTIAPSLELNQVNQMTAAALGSATSNLTFVPLPPCRIIDTRLAGGILTAGTVRSFQVAGVTEFGAQGGNTGGCGVPAGGTEPVAAAVMMNIVAVNVTGKGNLATWPYSQSEPLATSINFKNIDMNVANGLIVPIDGTNQVPADLNIKANFSSAHIVADVTGYFTRFPIEQFQATQKTITEVVNGGAVDLSAGTCTEVSSCTITAGATGKVIVRAWAQIQLDHGTNVGGDRIAVGVKNADPTNCTNNDQSINATDYEIPDALPAENDIDWTLSHKRIFSQAKGTRTYYINARMITGAGAGDLIQSSRMVCTFIPD
jgi:hypothetical protein